MKEQVIAILGLGYVGLPLAIEFAKKNRVIGYDTDRNKIKSIVDNMELPLQLEITSDDDSIGEATVYIVAVPTDVDEHKVPNISPLLEASRTIGSVLEDGNYVIFESTVYPGCTEEDCVPVLESTSGLQAIRDFKVGYSPERIVPGDRNRSLTKIQKIVSGCDSESLDFIASLYESIIEAGVYRAENIRIAEAAKVIENTQRDINISLMNELAIIFDKMEIDTQAVLRAASTKWNFHCYAPGLVGGHCISVDPFYLMHKAKELGHDPQVIAAGRRVNDYIPIFVSQKLVQKLIEVGKNPGTSHVLVMGITFKENVSDISHSKVLVLIDELQKYSIRVSVMDPRVDRSLVGDLTIIEKAESNKPYDAVIAAVAHDEFRDYEQSYFSYIMDDYPILFDLKSIYNFTSRGDFLVWSL